MKIKIAYFLFVAFLLHAGSVDAQRKISAPKVKVLTSRQIAEKVMPSVVLIITQDENGNPISQGSGFVYQPGLVVSNLHVFERASKAFVKEVKTGEVYEALEVVAMNAIDDLCVIRIKATKIPPIIPGESGSLRVGDEVFVASNPKGLEGSFTKGIISAIRKGERDSLLQIDAAVSSGSSGGVVVNKAGQAVGIVRSSVIDGQNLNFAVPITQLLSMPHRFKHPIELAGACAYSDKQKRRLAGSVKSVVERGDKRRLIDGRLIEGSAPMKEKIEFDRLGNEVELWAYDISGVFIFRYEILYDQNGLKTAIKQVFSDGQMKTVRFNPDESIDNKLLNRRFSGSVGSMLESYGKQIFDSKGNLHEWYLRDIKITFQYDNQGREKEKVESKNGRIQARTRYRYKDDENGNWIERTEYGLYFDLPNVDSTQWIEGDTTYREIVYFKD